MRSSGPYLVCRLCGKRYRSDKFDIHQKTCQQDQTIENSNKSDKITNAYLKEISSSKTLVKQTNDSDLNNQTENKGEKSSGKMTGIQSDQPDMLKEEKEEMVKTPYPSTSNINVVQNKNLSRSLPKRHPSKLSDAEPKQAWNANAKTELSAKPKPPKPTKKYRHYPVSCEFCNAKFQPGDLTKHIQKYHPDEHLPPHLRGKGKIKPPDEREKSIKPPSKSSGPRFKICYICGRQFGSKSLPIHEPKCLEKWHIQNEQLPPNKRMPEPVKPQTLADSSNAEKLPGSGSYTNELPELNDANEAAYQSHLKNLVPCAHCGRRFNPDRVMVHEGACIERPRKRQYITPDKTK